MLEGRVVSSNIKIRQTYRWKTVKQELAGSHESEDFSESPGTTGFMNLTLQERGSHESESPEKQGFGFRSHRTEGFIITPVVIPCDRVGHRLNLKLGSAAARLANFPQPA